MNTCLLHMVSYPRDGYCDKCGPPQYQWTGTTMPVVAPCTCPTMITMPPGQRATFPCQQHGLVTFSGPMVVS